MAIFNFETSGDYVNFRGSDNHIIRRLHNTSRNIAWGFDDSSPDRISFFVDKLFFENIDISGIAFDGVACDSLDDFQTGIEAMFTGYASGGGSVVGYPEGTKMYVALLTQTGENAPVATVGVNTLGGTLVWARSDVGTYTATLTGAFTSGKTFIFLQGYNNDDPETVPIITKAVRTSDNAITVVTVNGGTSTVSDLLLLACPIQILVFP